MFQKVYVFEGARLHVRQITRFNDFGDIKHDYAAPCQGSLLVCLTVSSSSSCAVSICCPLLVVGRLIKLTPQSNQIQIKIARIWKVVVATGRATTNEAGLEHMLLLLLLLLLLAVPGLQSSQLQGHKATGGGEWKV